MPDFNPGSFIAQVTFRHTKDGPKTQTHVTIDTEDIIAIFTGVVALIFAIAMVAGWVPINSATIGVATCSAAGSVLAEIIKVQRKKRKKSAEPPTRIQA
jgi:hypothetical protein